MTNQRLRSLLPALVCLSLGAAAALRAEDYSLTTFAGAANVVTGADGTPGSFNNPYGVAIDSAKNIYVTDTLNNTVRKITPARVVSTLAGTAGAAGNTDGVGAAARFNFPVGLAVDGGGNVYVSDSRNFTIRKVAPDGTVSTFAGTAFQAGSADGTGNAARFLLPYGVAVDSAGNVYVADGGNNTIRKITPGGVVTTLAGAAGQPGSANGTGGAARFSTPFGVAVDSAGNVYVADSGNNTIRKITSAGAVTTLAGVVGVSGAIDGAASAARFNQPRGVAVDAAGNVFVADYGNSVIRLIETNGNVSTIAGSAGIVGEVNSVGAAARLYDPTGIVADGSTIYIADTTNNQVRRGVPASAASLPEIVQHPLDQEISVGQTITLSVTASGANLSYQWLRNGTPISGATTATYALSSPQLSDSAAYSVRVSGAGGSRDSNPANISVNAISSGPIAITARPLSLSVAPGQSATFTVAATGSGLTYQWFRDTATLTGATNASFTIPSAQTSDAGSYTVRITSGTATESATAKLIVGGSSGTPITLNITSHPRAGTVELGKSITLSVTATGQNLTYQWFKDGAPIAGAISANYTIASAQQANAGTYFVRVASGAVSADSNPATLTIFTEDPNPNPNPGGPTSRLSNLSVRTPLAAGQTLIVGTTVSGGATNLLVRAAGPALAALGVGGAMTDPRLELFSGPTRVFENNDWSADLAPTFASVAAFPFPAGSRDAAFVRSIEGGPTIQVMGTAAGVVLVEAYDLGTGSPARLTNVSARNQVGTGDNILIAGFNISGTGDKRLLIRGVGPKLTAFGVTNFLADPKLEIYTAANPPVKIAENDNWAATLAPTFVSVGAFALDANSRDAALLTTLPPGSYTVQVTGVGGTTGEGLIEIYEAP